MVEEEEEMKRASARVGQILRGKYRIDRVVGIGGMAVVYAATHRNRKRFAVKMLHPELSSKPSIREKFIREGYVANTIAHPNALSVLDDDTTEDGAAFVVMELLEGLTLEQLAATSKRRLSVEVTLAIAHQLLDVLAAAHERSVVHRDIKPANVFLLRDGTVKVLDFGIARLLEADVAQSNTGMLLGTPAFLPPEQARGKSSEIDHRTDLWAAGATMFTLLTGEYVHQGESAADFVFTAASQPARSIAFSEYVPPAVAAIVDRALAFSKAERWPSAAAMKAAIGKAYADLVGEPISKRPIATLMALAAPVFEGPPSDQRMSDFDSVPVPIFEATVPVEHEALRSHDMLVDSVARPVVHVMPAPATRPRRLLALGATGVAVAALAIAGFFVVRGSLRPAPAINTAAPSAPPLESVAHEPSAAPSTPPPPSAAPVAAVPVAATTASAKERVVVAAPPRPLSPPAPPSPPASTSPVAPPPAPSKPPPSCKPPFELDAQGNKHWKPECL